MEQTKNDISLVVIDAVSPDIEVNSEVALRNIQALVDAGISNKVYELFIGESELRHNGTRVKRERVGQHISLDYNLQGEIILAGGSLGNEHYRAFISLLEYLKRENRDGDLHIPLDCTYSFEPRYDSGESWESGILGNKEMGVLKMYYEAMQRYAPAAYIIKCDGQVTERSPIFTLNVWSEWKKMADDLTAQAQAHK